MSFSDKLKEDIKRRAHFKCCLCRIRWATQVHHIKPESEGGPDTEDNAAPLCADCHGLYGGNPDMRKFIKQNRDFWYEQCEKSSPPYPKLIKEIHEQVLGPLATKEDLQNLLRHLNATLQEITKQPISTSAQLRQVSYATSAFSFATFKAMQDIYIVKKAIANQLNLTPEEVTDEKYAYVVSLDLSESEITDLTILQGLSNLQTLNLDETQVSDLNPLKGLSNLQKLDLGMTQVSDLTPLQGLINLQVLAITSPQVRDLTPLKGLSNLQRLELVGTQVTDLTPLKGLNNLQRLQLDNTQVSDLAPLKGLSNLLEISLGNTQVSAKQVKSLKKMLPRCKIYK